MHKEEINDRAHTISRFAHYRGLRGGLLLDGLFSRCSFAALLLVGHFFLVIALFLCEINELTLITLVFDN